MLDPENPDSFTEDEKPVRNFQWKLTGHIPETKKRYDGFSAGCADWPVFGNGGLQTNRRTTAGDGCLGDDLTYKESVTLDFLGRESAVRSNTMGIGLPIAGNFTEQNVIAKTNWFSR